MLCFPVLSPPVHLPLALLRPPLIRHLPLEALQGLGTPPRSKFPLVFLAAVVRSLLLGQADGGVQKPACVALCVSLLRLARGGHLTPSGCLWPSRLRNVGGTRPHPRPSWDRTLSQVEQQSWGNERGREWLLRAPCGSPAA